MTKYDNVSSASPCTTPWSRSAEEILDELSVRTEDGLSADEAARRLLHFDPNQLSESRPRSLLSLVLASLTSS